MAGGLDLFGIGSIAQAASSLANGIATNITNSNIAKQNIEYQKEANAQNIAFQREINDTNYLRQLEENNLTREREDNAVQRAAADLTKAGLSKTLAAGSSASSGSMNASQGVAPKVEALNNSYRYSQIMENVDMASLVNNMKKAEAEVSIMEEQAKGLSIENLFKEESLSEDVKSKILANSNMQYKNNMDKLRSENYELILKTGLDKDLSEIKVNNANYDYIEANREKVIAEKSKVIAEVNHLGKQDSLLVREMLKADLDYKISEYNLKKAMENGYTTTGSNYKLEKNLSIFNGITKAVSTGLGAFSGLNRLGSYTPTFNQYTNL